MRISDWSSDVCSSDLIGDPARALRLLPNPDGLQELNAPAGEHAPRQRNRRHEFAAQGMAVLGQRRLAVRRDQVGPVAERRDGVAGPRRRIVMIQHRRTRSEEHTSELQSLMRISYAVFCLKKKNTPKSEKHSTDHITSISI